MGTDQFRHRPGLLKQQNKAHKHGRHRSKGEINVAEKGRTALKVVTKRIRSNVSKDARRNQLVQNRLQKRQEVLQNKRLLGRSAKAPFLIVVLPLHFNVDTEKMLNLIKNCCEDNDVFSSPEGVLHISCNGLKQKFSFIIPQKGNFYAALDSLKVADTVLYVLSGTTDTLIDKESESMMMAVLAQGLPSTAVVAIDLENLPKKKKLNFNKDIQKAISKWLPGEKIFHLEKKTDGLNLLRKIGYQKRRRISQRDIRAHLLAEQLEFDSQDGFDVGVLKVSGYLRGQKLSVNSLVHIPGWGDFQMKQIDGWETQDSNLSMSIVKVLEVADPNKQYSLDSENIPDPMECEQTWPDTEDLECSKEKQKKLIKRVPKGMSEYQACWIPDEEIHEIDEYFDDDDDDNDQDGQEEHSEEFMNADDSDDDSKPKVRFDEDEPETMTITYAEDDKYDEGMDLNEEKKAKEKLQEAKLDQMFPDEVDTPQDIPARDRFQKYRGLLSFRTSPWDPNENLPNDYARIFQFENFNRTRKRIFSELKVEKNSGVAPGKYITIHIDKVPRHLYECHKECEPIVIIGMLEHEQKISVINMVLKRCVNTPWADIPLKSKEEFVFQCGYRRYKGRPIFSQHSNGNKHKYERYFQPSSVTVATLYAPIIFPPASVLLFKENPNGTQDVIATGSVLSVNPNRLVIKRIVLSGHPFKINKKSAVIRFMFFNRDDILWFKPVELKTKYGRRGHIKEPLGTHGHMKAVFDAQLKSQDVVLMLLYKRVFPKWTYDPIVKYSNSRYKPPIRLNEENNVEMI